MNFWVSEEARPGLRRLRAGWRLALFVLLLLAPVGVLLALRPAGARGASTAVLAPGPMLASEAIELGWVVLISWLFSMWERRPLGDYGLPGRGAFRSQFWTGVVWGAVALSVLLALMAISGAFSFGTVATGGRELLHYGLVWGLVFLAVGFFEEFSFRGYALVTLREGIGFLPAAVVLSLAFGAVHLGNSGESYVGGLSAGLIGLFFCFTYWRTGTLWFAVGMHAAWDYCESFVYGVPDSGLTAPGHLLNPRIHGARWLTGGSVGPEGSVWAFVVIGVSFWLFARRYPERSGGGAHGDAWGGDGGGSGHLYGGGEAGPAQAH